MKSITFRLDDIARQVSAKVIGDGSVLITGIAPFDAARPGDITFLANKKLLKSLKNCEASVVITHPDFISVLEKGKKFSLLVTEHPQLAFARIMQLFFPSHRPDPGIHQTAVVSPTTNIAPSAHLGPFVCISDYTMVGENSVLMAGVYIGKNVKIGRDCILYPRVVILDGCVIGNGVVVHAGTVIGSDGFGYVPNEKGMHVKIPQVGNVVIEDDVEIGANCTIDRATLGSTQVGQGTKIDNLVHVAHNVVIGKHCILAGQVGIAGSSRVSDHVIMAGQVGIADHVNIGSGVRIGAKSGVAADIPPRTDVVGIPAIHKDDFFKMYANVKRIDRLKKDIERLKEFVLGLKPRRSSDNKGDERNG